MIRRRACSGAAPQGSVCRLVLLVLLVPLVLAVLGACGAAASEGGGDTDLPTRGAGPFGPLEPDPETPVEEPVLLADPDEEESWRAPSFRKEEDGTLTVYFAAASSAGVEIRRALGVSLAEGAAQVDSVLVAEESWEGSRVDHPALIVPGVSHEVGLFYEAGDGAIGYAGSDDGVLFERAGTAPVLVGNGGDEGSLLGEPTAVWLGGDLWLYYAARERGAIYAARFPGGDLAIPERLDSDARTASRDPVLGPNPFDEQFDVGGVGAPHVRITRRAGRPVFDLWYAGWDASGKRTVGFAGSLDGLLYKRFDENPVLPTGSVRRIDPCVISMGIGALMLYTHSPESGPEVIAAAVH